MIIDLTERNIKQLTDLWSTVFGDEEEYIRLLFSSLNSGFRVLGKILDGKIVSALYMFDAEIEYNEKNCYGYYIYACATFREYRSQGFLGSLLNEAKTLIKSENKDFLCLVPAEPSLYEYYSRFRFEKGLVNNNTKYISNKSLTERDIIEISAEKYQNIRKKYLKNKFLWNDTSFNYVSSVYSYMNICFYDTNEYSFILDKNNSNIIELIIKGSLKFDCIAQEICSMFNMDFVSFRMQNADEYHDFGMIFTENNHLKNKKIYMNIALE